MTIDYLQSSRFQSISELTVLAIDSYDVTISQIQKHSSNARHPRSSYSYQDYGSLFFHIPIVFKQELFTM